jgi:pimeloyl-ACP methyl ester carboxylesterase
MLPLLARSKRLRHWILRDIAVHGERVSPAELLALADDTIGCEIVEDLLATDAQLAPLDPPPCPVTLAWSGQDRLFPVDVYGSHARELIPRASFIVLDDVGHVPMLDDPQLVAQTILAVTAANSHRDTAEVSPGHDS